MFKLRRLEITGFKSFADHTDLIFTGDGITGIVGPNGCGKSNVADAIAWVLGEQRVKHLRGGEMKDVIFQGSRNRPPSGMSEVVLHLERDEVIEHEPDIEDIDSTLEQIDEQASAFEEVESVSGPRAVATGSADGGLEISDFGLEDSSSAALNPQFAIRNQQSDDPVATGPGSETEVVEAAAPARAPVDSKSTPHHRHWRRRNLALEFAPGEAVSVTRRLYRSGESEYLLNDRPCRLRDIQDLFSGTGLAGGHYAIIEQGRIGQILSAKPMDRRTIIEEAAGITKFRVRQRAAEGRLESARANLSRVADIISEIERQVNSLRWQAAKARRYRIQREELRELLRRVYVAEEMNLTTLLQETFEDELAQVRASIAEAALQRDRRIRERVYQEQQIEALTKRHREIESEIKGLDHRSLLVESELARLRELDTQLSAETEKTNAELRSAEGVYAQKLALVAEGENEIETARVELLTHTAAFERLNELARQLEAALAKLAQQAEGLAREGERAASVHAERTAEAERLNQQISAARERIARLNTEREAAVKAVVEGHERVSDTDAEQTRVRD